MNRRTESLLLAAMGIAALVLSVDGGALAFIRPGLVAYLLVSGVVLLLLAAAPAVRRSVVPDHTEAAETATEHEHGHSRRAPWLVLAPLLVLLVVAPGPLGASAARTAQRAVTAQAGSYPPVGRQVDGAVPMTLAEYSSRAVEDDDHSLAGVPVRLVGFVTKAKEGNGFVLSRFTIFCCAADAEIQQVRVLGWVSALPENSWVAITGTWPGVASAAVSAQGALPELTATAVVEVKRPRAPYEYTLQYAD